MVVVVDAGTGNLRSLRNALAGRPLAIEAEPPVHLPDAVIVPGVGAFGHAMASLRSAGWEPFLRRALDRGIPVIGICLGMQLFFERSEESPGVPGLGLLAGDVRRFQGAVKVPHIGWSRLEPEPADAASVASSGLTWAYFVHSYVARPEDPGLVAAWARHGERFPAVVRRGSLVGVQFHPEKSQGPGLAYLRALLAGGGP